MPVSGVLGISGNQARNSRSTAQIGSIFGTPNAAPTTRRTADSGPGPPHQVPRAAAADTGPYPSAPEGYCQYPPHGHRRRHRGQPRGHPDGGGADVGLVGRDGVAPARNGSAPACRDPSRREPHAPLFSVIVMRRGTKKYVESDSSERRSPHGASGRGHRSTGAPRVAFPADRPPARLARCCLAADAHR